FEQWCAYPLQHLGAKLKTSPVLYSKTQGVGKNSVTGALGRVYGDNAVEIGEGELDDDFNSWQNDRQLVIADEVHGGDDKKKLSRIEKVKRLVTAETVCVNEKFKPKYEVPNRANYIFLTNDPSPFLVRNDDRRLWIWEIQQDEPLAKEFYMQFHA